MAIPTHASLSWQAIISDIQALLSYAYDSILMRQELSSYDSSLIAAARLKSRGKSVARMVRKIPFAQPVGKITIQDKFDFFSDSVELPKENWLDYISTIFSVYLGSIPSLIFYRIGIFVWVAFGPYCAWSNNWQLHINSATSGS